MNVPCSLPCSPPRACSPSTRRSRPREPISRRCGKRRRRARRRGARDPGVGAAAAAAQRVGAVHAADDERRATDRHQHRRQRADHDADRASFANSTNGSLTLSQLVWDFGQTWNRFQAAQFSRRGPGQDQRTPLNDVALGVRAAFFSARAAKELLRVAKETLDNQERHLEQMQGFVEVGTRPAIDLAQARTDRANARVQLISGAERLRRRRARR